MVLNIGMEAMKLIAKKTQRWRDLDGGGGGRGGVNSGTSICSIRLHASNKYDFCNISVIN